MTLDEVMTTLRALGSEQTRKTMRKHGAPDSEDLYFGVLVGDLKPIAKKIKGDQALALALYDTGNTDAMYLAGLVADGAKMSRAQLNAWAVRALLRRAVAEVHAAPDRVRYTMNGFIIAVGSYVTPLGPEALAAAETIGKVTVNMGGTACKVPLATDTIQKVIGMGRQGKKRKTAMC